MNRHRRRSRTRVIWSRYKWTITTVVLLLVLVPLAVHTWYTVAVQVLNG